MHHQHPGPAIGQRGETLERRRADPIGHQLLSGAEQRGGAGPHASTSTGPLTNASRWTARLSRHLATGSVRAASAPHGIWTART